MNKKIVGLVLVATLLLTTTVVTAEEAPWENYFYNKLLPAIQGLATIVCIVAAIYGATKLNSENTDEVAKGKKILIGSAISVAAIWLIPQIVEWLKP